MGMMDHLIDRALQVKIEGKERAHQRTLREQRSRSRKLEERVSKLEDDVAEMALVVRTLFRMLVEKGTVDRNEFLLVARKIDAQDGTTDGKYSGPMGVP